MCVPSAPAKPSHVFFYSLCQRIQKLYIKAREFLAHSPPSPSVLPFPLAACGGRGQGGFHAVQHSWDTGERERERGKEERERKGRRGASGRNRGRKERERKGRRGASNKKGGNKRERKKREERSVWKMRKRKRRE